MKKLYVVDVSGDQNHCLQNAMAVSFAGLVKDGALDAIAAPGGKLDKNYQELLDQLKKTSLEDSHTKDWNAFKQWTLTAKKPEIEKHLGQAFRSIAISESPKENLQSKFIDEVTRKIEYKVKLDKISDESKKREWMDLHGKNFPQTYYTFAGVDRKDGQDILERTADKLKDKVLGAFEFETVKRQITTYIKTIWADEKIEKAFSDKLTKDLPTNPGPMGIPLAKFLNVNFKIHNTQGGDVGVDVDTAHSVKGAKDDHPTIQIKQANRERAGHFLAVVSEAHAKILQPNKKLTLLDTETIKTPLSGNPFVFKRLETFINEYNKTHESDIKITSIENPNSKTKQTFNFALKSKTPDTAPVDIQAQFKQNAITFNKADIKKLTPQQKRIFAEALVKQIVAGVRGGEAKTPVTIEIAHDSVLKNEFEAILNNKTSATGPFKGVELKVKGEEKPTVHKVDNTAESSAASDAPKTPSTSDSSFSLS